MGLNVLTVTGTVGPKGVTLRQVGDTQVASFSIVAEAGFGERKKATWIQAEVWGKAAESVAQYVQPKQAGVGVTGEFWNETYTDRDGKERTQAKIGNAKVSFAPKGSAAKVEADSEADDNGYAPMSYDEDEV